MSVKPTHSTPSGPITRGKGLDALDRFIIQNWPPSCRFGLWSIHAGALSVPKSSLERFFNTHLEELWTLGEDVAMITIDPSGEPFVALRVENEHRHRTPESKYKPAHWGWKLVSLGEALPILEAASRLELPSAEHEYLEGLRDGRLREAWSAYTASQGTGQPG